MRKKTPIGAKSITKVTTFIITSFNFSAVFANSRPISPVINIAIANKITKKIICNILPSAKALIGLLGTILIKTSVSGGAGFGVKLDVPATCSKPSPGAIIIATNKAKEIAIPVVKIYKPKALTPTRPKTDTSPMPHTPQINEKVTKGTTNIFNALTNAVPTT